MNVNVRDESFLLDLQDSVRASSAQSPVLHFPRVVSQRVTSALKILLLLWPEVACLREFLTLLYVNEHDSQVQTPCHTV